MEPLQRYQPNGNLKRRGNVVQERKKMEQTPKDSLCVLCV